MLLHNLTLYRRMLSINIRAQKQYRTAFLLDLIGTGLGSWAAFGTLALTLWRFGDIGGWSLADIAFLYGTVETGFGLMDMLFSGFNPGRFGQQVRRGTFDQLLLRPVNIFTYGGIEMMTYPMSVYSTNLRRFFTYIVPAIFINYYPALYILDKPDPFDMPAGDHWLAPVVGVGMLIAALTFWNFGIQHYQSPGT